MIKWIKRVILYARVSTERQDSDDKVSINQQLEDMKALCQRQGWQIVGIFIDKEKYRKTKPPYKGKIKEPSGEYDDRPQFLEMLKVVEAGQVDVVVYWDSYRFGRHYRVIGSFMTSLEIGDKLRNGQGDIEIWEASKNSPITRMLLGIMTSIGKEENDSRKRRVKMGKIGTLKQGRWPSPYDKLGYKSISEPGKRGRLIILADEMEVKTVKKIFNLADAGKSSREIRKILIAERISQKGTGKRKRDWTPSLIRKILYSEEYIGKLTWHYEDGTEYVIEIPQIITPEQFKRVQEKLSENKALSKRNTKNVYPLQGILYCGECNAKISVTFITHEYNRLKDGTVKRYERKFPYHQYVCRTYLIDDHPKPYKWTGPSLDYAIWRKIADNVVRSPDLIINQVTNRQIELQEQGDDMNSEINKANSKLVEIEDERAFYQRQAARKIMTEKEFDARMAETEESRLYWLEQLDHLKELRDDALKVRSGLNYAQRLLESISEKLPEIDQTTEELKKLPKEKRDWILLERQKVIRALSERILVFANGQIEIQGILDGSEIQQFEDTPPCGRLHFAGRCFETA